MTRPITVTVVCWIIVALAIEAMIGLLSGIVDAPLKDMVAKAGSGMSFSQTVVSSTLAAALNIVFALFMLRGANWARIAYLCLFGFMLLGMLVIHSRVPTAILASTSLKAVVFGYFLLRPEAGKFFSGELVVQQGAPADNPPPLPPGNF